MITVTVANANRLRLAFPYNPILVAFIKDCSRSEFDKVTKTWTVTFSTFDLLVEKYPDYVEVDYTAWALLADRPRRFAQSLIDMGIRFYVDGKRVIADGEGVSPLLQEEVDKRAAAIADLMRSGVLVYPNRTVVRSAPAPQSVLAAHEERIVNAVRTGSVNARIAEERKQAQAQARRTKARKQQTAAPTFTWNRG